MPKPIPMLAPLELLVECWLAVLFDASRFTSLSAESTTLLPAVMSLPIVVRLLFSPAPVALMLTLPPAAMVEP